jgi:hypothetical protein
LRRPRPSDIYALRRKADSALWPAFGFEVWNPRDSAGEGPRGGGSLNLTLEQVEFLLGVTADDTVDTPPIFPKSTCTYTKTVYSKGNRVLDLGDSS